MPITYLEKGRWGHAMPEGIVRVNKKSLSVSRDVSETFQVGRRTLDSGIESVSLRIGVDPQAKQIQLVPDQLNGFAFNVRGDDVLRWTVNKKFKALELPIGDYPVVNKEENIFQLAR